MKRNALVHFAVGVVVLSSSMNLFAQQDRVAEQQKRLNLPRVEWHPTLLANQSLTVMDAVRTALANDPNISLTEVSSNLQRGVLQEISGQFDTTLLGNFTFQFTQQELSAGALKAEKDKRAASRDQAEDLRKEAENEERILAEVLRLQADPDNYHSDVPEVQSEVDLINILLRDADDPQTRDALIAARNDEIEKFRAAQQARVDYLRSEEAKELDRLRKLGAVPQIDQSFSGQVDLRLVKPTRTGVVLGTFLTLGADGSNFRGKGRATSIGGKGVTDLYRADAGVTFDIPLGRGAGRETTTARERSARIDYEASRLFLKHASSTTALATVLSYWDVVAAQQSVAAFEESVRLQGRLVDLTSALIQGDELPAAELPRVQASAANISGTLSSARRQLYNARVRLAESMGIRVDSDANVPVPTSDFPPVLSDDEIRRIDASALAAASPERRFDFAAARQLQESGGVLLRAALLDLKPRVDLNGELKYSGVGESSSVRFGLNEALFHKWVGPSVKLGLAIDWPIENNIQRGRALQAQADYDRRSINFDNLDRTIRSNVILTHQSLLEAAAAVRSSEAAIRYYRELVDAEFEKLRLGSSTLIDTLLTEQRRTEAALGYISARAQYAQLLAQLRFETGTLVEATDEGGRIEAENFTRPPQANR